MPGGLRRGEAFAKLTITGVIHAPFMSSVLWTHDAIAGVIRPVPLADDQRGRLGGTRLRARGRRLRSPPPKVDRFATALPTSSFALRDSLDTQLHAFLASILETERGIGNCADADRQEKAAGALQAEIERVDGALLQ